MLPWLTEAKTQVVRCNDAVTPADAISAVLAVTPLVHAVQLGAAPHPGAFVTPASLGDGAGIAPSCASGNLSDRALPAWFFYAETGLKMPSALPAAQRRRYTLLIAMAPQEATAGPSGCRRRGGSARLLTPQHEFGSGKTRGGI